MISIIVGIITFLLFLLFQTQGIYTGDSGDLVTAAYLGGIPHPPGYPLYTLLGFIASKIPLFTVAWRVGLLSSLSHAITAGIVTTLILKATKMRVAAIFGATLLVGNYLFFLYSITPEVFALFDMFVVLILYIMLLYFEEQKATYLWSLSLIVGLALSHHHAIIFLVPAIAYVLYAKRKSLQKSTLARCAFFFFLGLLPYFYIPIAARGNAIINWDKPVDIPNFIRLITRADYGTFISSGFYGAATGARMVQLRAFARFFFIDFGWVGFILGMLGIFGIWKKMKSYGIGLLLGVLFLGPVFFFYASFPLVNRFTLGTYERFLLPSYLIVTIFISFGIAMIVNWFKKNLSREKQWVVGALVLILSIYPISNIGITLWRFWGIQNDRTAEELGRDILRSVPENGILLLQSDTALFVTQYVRYVLGVRPDVALLHATRLFTTDYPEIISLVFPDISIPEDSSEDYTRVFIQANMSKYPIVSIAELPLPSGWYWVPHGLLYLLTEESQLPEPQALLASNNAIWSQYNDPNNGILDRYNHLMLADTRNVYTSARLTAGKTLMRAGLYEEARAQFEHALAIGGENQLPDIHIHMGLTELFLKSCESALRSFASARSTSMTPDLNVILYEASVYRDCLHDTVRADRLTEEYESAIQEQETPLLQQ